MSKSASIEAFLTDYFRCFETGDPETASKCLRYPLDLHISQKLIRLETAADFCATSVTYRENLCIEGYVRTAIEYLFHDFGQGGVARTLLTITNFNSLGAVINKIDACYICRQSDAGTWIIEEIDLMVEINERRSSGLALR